jgi:uncharacterized protein YjbI with pentapeptide repeats
MNDAADDPSKPTSAEIEFREISDEELRRILADHKKWVAADDKTGLDHLRADLSWADLRGHAAILKVTQLEGAVLDLARLEGVDLIGARLQAAELFGSRLQTAKLGEAQLQGAWLRGAQLQGARLYKTQLHGAILEDAILEGASLTDANFRDADLSNAQLATVTGGSPHHWPDWAETKKPL